jgi:hypothetical protein
VHARLAPTKFIVAVLALGVSFFKGPAKATDVLPTPAERPASSEVAPQWLGPQTPTVSDPRWAVTVLAGASAGEDRLVELMTSPWNGDFRDDYFIGGALSRKLARFWTYFSVETELGVGGRLGHTNAGELWGAVYFRFDGFPWNNVVHTTAAVSTGLDYISKLPAAETHPGDATSHVLHYFSPELTFALPQFKYHELVFRYHHRSGVFGTFNNVWGGSNVLALGYRYRFDSFGR